MPITSLFESVIRPLAITVGIAGAKVTSPSPVQLSPAAVIAFTLATSRKIVKLLLQLPAVSASVCSTLPTRAQKLPGPTS